MDQGAGAVEPGRGPRLRGPLIALLALIAAGNALDLALDRAASVSPLHVASELAVIAATLTAIVFLVRAWQRERRALARLRHDLRSHRAERDAWRGRAEKLLRGLGEAIEEQFRSWQLTPAESQIALLLLKGYGLKEIAALLERSERTVRQHAIAVYRKSGLAGRAELSAFFLEDLLLPHADTPPSQPDPAPPRPWA